MKRCVCYIGKWQIHLFIYRGTFSAAVADNIVRGSRDTSSVIQQLWGSFVSQSLKSHISASLYIIGCKPHRLRIHPLIIRAFITWNHDPSAKSLFTGPFLQVFWTTNEMNRALGHLGLRPSTLPLGHAGSPQYWLSHVDGGETFLFLSNRRDREPNPELWRERQRC